MAEDHSKESCCYDCGTSIPSVSTPQRTGVGEDAEPLNNIDRCSGELCDEQCIEMAAAMACHAACDQEQSRDNNTAHQESCCTTVTCCEKEEDCLSVKSVVSDSSLGKSPDMDTHDHRHDVDSLHDHDHDHDHNDRHHDHDHGHEHKHDQHGRHLTEACADHMRAAFEKYTSYLQQARCICKNILSEQLDQCCSKQPVPASDHAECSSTGREQHRVRHRTSISRHPSKRTSLHRHDHQSARSGRLVPSGTRQNAAKLINNHRLTDHDPQEIKNANATVQFVADVEKGGNLEHVLVNVTGMDCSGCANNLARALKGIRGTSGVRVTFITGTAEFDVDIQVTSVDEVTRDAERATGYKLTRFSTDTQMLEINMDVDAGKIFCNNLPRGVTYCDIITKNIYGVSYDPCLIGARQVLHSTSTGTLAPPRGDNDLAAGRKRLIDTLIKTCITFVLTVPVAVIAWGSTSMSEREKLYVSIILATFVQIIAYPEFYKPAISALIYNRVLEMDMLIVISLSAAYGYSIVIFGLKMAGKNVETEPLFETSTLLITLVLLGRLVAAFARKKAVAAVSLKSLQATTALLVGGNGDTGMIDARLVQFGDKIQVLPHSQIVTDSEVLCGTSEVDESMLTGESMPVMKTAGDSVIAGTMNGTGPLTVRVMRLPGRNTITDIANLVGQAQSSKPQVQDLADRIAGYFIPVVVFISIIVTIVWLVVALRIRYQSTPSAIGTSISYGIAVLAISCPCALGLAVPMVLVVAGGVAARAGIVIKSADVTERGYKVTDVIFDKTGTLTQGELNVVEEQIFENCFSRSTVYSLVKSLVNDNAHPVSRAVASALKKLAGEKIVIEKSKSIPGAGIEATWKGKTIRAGNPFWLDVEKMPRVAEQLMCGVTLLCVKVDDKLVAIFSLRSLLRPEAKNVINELQRRKINVHVVSGDAQTAVENVAISLGIPLSAAVGCKSPAQKREYVSTLMDQGKITLFCGDGTNDAVAIAQAHVGIQIESSSDVTRATADVILLGSLKGVVDLLDISKAAFHRIVFNFVWSAVYNLFAILFAAGAFVKVRVPPAYAGLGEIVSVLPVIVVALTMPRLGKKSANRR